MALSEPPTEGLDLEALYTQLQAHLEAEQWVEAIAACYRILNTESDYRDVSQLLERARKQLAFDREQSRGAREAWHSTLTPAREATHPRRRRWLSLLLILGVSVGLVGVVLAIVIFIPRGQKHVPVEGTGSESVQPPSASMAVTDMQYYVNSEGHFLLKYPEDWTIEESPAEEQSLRVVIITPEARDQPERITILFAQGSGQGAEQVWVSVLGLIQAMQDEETEDWLLGEATSTVIGGYHARQMPFRYSHLKSESEWRGLIMGMVYDSMNYALISEAPMSRWSKAWPLFEQILDSIQFQ